MEHDIKAISSAPGDRLAEHRFFDPDMLDAMGTAFDVAWSFIRASGDRRFPDDDRARRWLAEGIIHAAQVGKRSKLDLANEAIRRLRARPATAPVRQSP